jgi:hypothetical protein
MKTSSNVKTNADAARMPPECDAIGPGKAAQEVSRPDAAAPWAPGMPAISSRGRYCRLRLPKDEIMIAFRQHRSVDCASRCDSDQASPWIIQKMSNAKNWRRLYTRVFRVSMTRLNLLRLKRGIFGKNFMVRRTNNRPA